MYQIENPIGRVQSGLSQAAGTYGSMMKNIPGPEKPGPTIGGGIGAVMGGTAAAASVGSLLTSGTAAAATGTAAAAGGTAAATGALAAIGGPVTLAIGAGLGLAAYLFS